MKRNSTEKELMKKNREVCREEVRRDAMKSGIYNGEKQLYSERDLPALCTRINVKTEYDKDAIVEIFEDIEYIFGLRHIVLQDYLNGQIDISYIDSKEDGYILHLEDDPEFVKRADELRSYGVIPLHGIKWDGQASPVFACYMDLPDTVGDCDECGCKILPSGSASAGISVRANYRYNQLGVYFWINDKLYDEYFEFECHDGVLYPVLAFPDLPDKDGIEVDDIKFLSDR